jgi:hypothetical protein
MEIGTENDQTVLRSGRVKGVGIVEIDSQIGKIDAK